MKQVPPEAGQLIARLKAADQSEALHDSAIDLLVSAQDVLDALQSLRADAG